MSNLRPFNTSKKAPRSVMLKGFNTDRNVTKQLEIDSRRMEEKLSQLKDTMSREKQERQTQGRGNIWASGKPSGLLTTQGSETRKKPSPSRPGKPSDKNKVRRIKVLKDVPLDIPERPKANGLSAGDSLPARKSIKGPVCGQCESKAVSLTCMECGENYCTTCFARFHLKGALRNHRSVPFQQPSSNAARSSWEDANNNNSDVPSKRPETPKSSRGSTSHGPSTGARQVVIVRAEEDTSQSGGALLQGEYDEEESAASFAAALAEWRSGHQQEKAEAATPAENKPEVHDRGVGDTSVALSANDMKRLEIKFSDDSTLSYADKLLLKQHRKSPRITPSPTTNDWNLPPSSLQTPDMDLDSLDLDAEMTEEHKRCVSIFSHKEEEGGTWMERPSSQLMITEVNELMEGDLEVESVYCVEESPPVAQRPEYSSRCKGVPITGAEEPMETSIDWNDLSELDGGHKTSQRPGVQQEVDQSIMNRDHYQGDKLMNTIDSESAVTGGGEMARGRSETSSIQGIRQVPGRVISSRKGSRKGRNQNSERRSENSSGGTKSGHHSSCLGEQTDQISTKMTSRGQSMGSKVSPGCLEDGAARGLGLKTVLSDEAHVTSMTTDDRPVKDSSQHEEETSKGLTRAPSGDLKRVVKQGTRSGQHYGYSDGLGGFFLAGMGEQEDKETQQEEQRPSGGECTYQGPVMWRPSSSLSQNLGTVHTPSPPKQSRENGSGSASLRRKKSASKKAKLIEENTISWVLSQQPPPPGMEGPMHPSAGMKRPVAVGLHGNNNAAPGASSSDRECAEPRSQSRIEIEGDDFARFDEDDGMVRQDAADEETLDELTWELASQSGRISADGRITSISLQEVEPYVESSKFASSLDEELGIKLDDGRGSGLSTPDDQELNLEAGSREDLLETQRDKQAVQELDDFI